LSPHLPLTEATADEIIARTVYQIVLADYRTNPLCYDRPVDRLLDLALGWRETGLELIADGIQSCAFHVAGGNTIASWRTIHSGLTLQRMTALRRAGRSRGR
jgi:hypothetical protein